MLGEAEKPCLFLCCLPSEAVGSGDDVGRPRGEIEVLKFTGEVKKPFAARQEGDGEASYGQQWPSSSVDHHRHRGRSSR